MEQTNGGCSPKAATSAKKTNITESKRNTPTEQRHLRITFLAGRSVSGAIRYLFSFLPNEHCSLNAFRENMSIILNLNKYLQFLCIRSYENSSRSR